MEKADIRNMYPYKVWGIKKKCTHWCCTVVLTTEISKKQLFSYMLSTILINKIDFFLFVQKLSSLSSKYILLSSSEHLSQKIKVCSNPTYFIHVTIIFSMDKHVIFPHHFVQSPKRKHQDQSG